MGDLRTRASIGGLEKKSMSKSGDGGMENKSGDRGS